MTIKTLTKKMKERQKQGDSLFVPYIMAGANGLEKLPAEIKLLVSHGAAAIEIGVPFSDPVADGPVIQTAGMQALANGTTLKKIIAALKVIESEVPLVLMGYANSFFHYGIQRLADDLKNTDVKGVIIPDLPFEHRALATPTFDTADLALITLVSLTSPPERIQTLIEEAEGFVYAVTVNGVTGEDRQYNEQLDQHLQVITDKSPIPVLAGFGVSTHADVQRFNRVCDGVVIGSKIVAALQNDSLPKVSEMLTELVGES
ncbi:tryptophan synthase subunit alpha [Enterococcus sp.]|uniref:tryptophan synthase subunit alpha n=1 Tax=Enterococcus sp. TaxID=35783 RepID=UPI0025BB0C54|nr:tryptophan synthase subunit alpha [Enterococcus sp.]